MRFPEEPNLLRRFLSLLLATVIHMSGVALPWSVIIDAMTVE